MVEVCFACFGDIWRQLCGLFSVKVDFWRKVRYSSVFPQNLSINNSDPACFIGVDGWGVWCVFVSGCVLSVWRLTWCSRFRLVFDVWCYYYILLYIHIIISIIIYYITISYLILYSSYHLSSSPLSNIPFLSSSHLSNLLIPFIQSIRVGSSISLFIFQTQPTFDPACFIGVDGWGV